MAGRIQLNVTHYMDLDGQPQIVLPGSVVDVANPGQFANTATLLLTEMAGALGPRMTAASVRNVSKR